MGARLNILPQKRWNVYNRDNISRVQKDEKEAAQAQAEKDATHLLAEREYRRAMLLKRAQSREGATDTSAIIKVENTPDTEILEAWRLLKAGKEEKGMESEAAEDPIRANELAAPKQTTTQAADFNVLDFLRTEPKRDPHPEVHEEKKKEARKRGEEKTQTSDARFDAKFAFGHGLTHPSAQPWYAKAQPSEPPPCTRHPVAALTGAGLRGLAPLAASPSEELVPAKPRNDAEGHEVSGAQRSKEGRREREERSKKAGKWEKSEKRKEKEYEKKKKKRKLAEGEGSGGGGDGAKKADLVAVLRRERDERERLEREKARLAVLEASGRLDGGPEGKRYHSSYGSKRARP